MKARPNADGKSTLGLCYLAEFVAETGETGKQCSWIAIRLPALLVEGIPQAPMNAEFHSAAARPLDAFIRLRIAPNMTFEGSVPLTAKKNREANLLPAFLAGFSLFFSPLDPTGKQTLTGKEIVSGCDDGTF